MKLKRYVSVVVSLFALSAWVGINSAAARELRWNTVIGVQQTQDQVGVGTGAVLGGAPWETLGGAVLVDLTNGTVKFNVQGLILAVGSVSSLGVTGAPIGTTAGVTQVKGTLVCNLDGSGNNGNSIDIDTPATNLSARGNAQFSGSFVSSLPALCATQDNDAFLIRIVEPSTFANAWIAFAAVPIGH
jgi:hypothetical protein